MFDYIFYKLVDIIDYTMPALDSPRKNYINPKGAIFFFWLGNYATILLFFRDSELWQTLFLVGLIVLFVLPLLLYPKRRCEMIVKKFDAMPKEKLQNKKTAAIIYVIASIVVPIVIFRATR